jgi:hypothetical protein
MVKDQSVWLTYVVELTRALALNTFSNAIFWSLLYLLFCLAGLRLLLRLIHRAETGGLFALEIFICNNWNI